MDIGIISYNTCALLRSCLRSVSVQSPEHLVVVDNGSSDGSIEMVRSEFPEAKLVVNAANSGFGAAVNQAVSNTSSEFVLILNADTVLHPGAADSLAAYLREHSQVALAGPRLANPDSTLQRSCRRFPGSLPWLLDNNIGVRLTRRLPPLRNVCLCAWRHDTARSVPWVIAAAIAIRRQAFEQVGGFDEAFFMYCEEIDLCYRLRRAGWDIHFAPVTTVTHAGGASTTQFRARMAHEVITSTMRFYRRHYTGLRLASLILLLRCILLARLFRDQMKAMFSHAPQQRAVAREMAGVWRTRLWQMSPEERPQLTARRV